MRINRYLWILNKAYTKSCLLHNRVVELAEMEAPRAEKVVELRIVESQLDTFHYHLWPELRRHPHYQLHPLDRPVHLPFHPSTCINLVPRTPLSPTVQEWLVLHHSLLPITAIPLAQPPTPTLLTIWTIPPLPPRPYPTQLVIHQHPHPVQPTAQLLLFHH